MEREREVADGRGENRKTATDTWVKRKNSPFYQIEDNSNRSKRQEIDEDKKREEEMQLDAPLGR
jgi:hypothetical protein